MDIKKGTPRTDALNNQSDYNKYLRKLSSGTQNHKVLKYMIEHGSITSYEAFSELRVTRLSARIRDIKDLGCPVYSEMVVKPDGTHYSQYFLGVES